MAKRIGDDKEEYIKKLEEEINVLTKRYKCDSSEEKIDYLVSKQEELVNQLYKEREKMYSDNQRLSRENANLVRAILLNHDYINYLTNSFWWKLIYPFRLVYRKFKNKKLDYNFVANVLDSDSIRPIESVSVIIFTYNAGEEFSVQLDYLKKQKYINNLEIIVIDRGSKDNTIKYAKEAGATIIDMKDTELTDSEIYESILPSIHGEYVVINEQNKIVDSEYWIYQSIIPLVDDMAVSTIFLKENISGLTDTSCYRELKSRVTKLYGELVFFFPKNRDVIQYISPAVLDLSSIVVKKRISNMFLV